MPRSLDLTPPHTEARFFGPAHTLQAMRKAAHGPRGERSLLVRSVTEQIVSGIHPKDYLSEILAIRYWVAKHVRYANDPTHVELIKDPQRLVEEVQARGIATGDCDDGATLIATMAMQLGRDARLVAVGFGKPGQYSHVFAKVLEPKSKTWIVCDPVAGTDEASMLARVKTRKEVDLNEAA